MSDGRSAEKGLPKPDHIVEAVACPACKAERGTRCTTRIDGEDVGWTHDARFYSKLAADIRASVTPPGGSNA